VRIEARLRGDSSSSRSHHPAKPRDTAERYPAGACPSPPPARRREAPRTGKGGTAGAGAQRRAPPRGGIPDDAKLARKEKRFEDCYRNALGAWKLAPRAGVAALLGDCALDVDKPRDAAEYIAFFLANVPPNATPELLSYQKERFALAKAKVAIVTVKPSVASAKVTVDKKPADGAAVYLDPGSHTFEATAEGYQSASATVDLPAGSERDVPLELVKLPDGDIPTEEPGAWMTYAPGGIVFGLGIAGIIVGIPLFFVAKDKDDTAGRKLDELRAATGAQYPCVNGANAEVCNYIADKQQQHDTFLGAARGMAAAGGAVAGVGIALFIIAAVTEPKSEPSSSEPEEALHILPWSPPGSLGAGITIRH
jgi:hypothetical protein